MRINSKGFSLIEFMMAISISLLMMGFLIVIYIAEIKNLETQSALDTIQENARIITRLFRSAIQTAGYIGCAHLTEKFPLSNGSPIEFTSKNIITKSNLNALTMRRASMNYAALTKNMRSNSILYITNKQDYAVGDLLLVSDCKSVDLFVVKNSMAFDENTQKIITENPLVNKYAKNAEVRRLEVSSYYIADTGRKTTQGKPIPALYMHDLYNNKTELVEGVDDMIINFDEGVHANSPISGVSIQFMLQSQGNVFLQKPWKIYSALRV